jgi:hypothetical protein
MKCLDWFQLWEEQWNFILYIRSSVAYIPWPYVVGASV